MAHRSNPPALATAWFQATLGMPTDEQLLNGSSHPERPLIQGPANHPSCCIVPGHGSLADSAGSPASSASIVYIARPPCPLTGFTSVWSP